MHIANQSQENKELAEKITTKTEKMKSERSALDSHVQECMDYMVPRKGTITHTGVPGSKRNTELFDTTAIMANQFLGGALHGMLTNASTQFFDLVMGDPQLDDDDEVKAWLQKVAELIFLALANTNFQTEVHEIYIDLGAIGTACLYMGEHEENLIHFSARPFQEYYIDENNLGLVDTVHRVFKWRPRQIIQEFGEANLPEEIVAEYKKGCDDEWEIIHAVDPYEIGNAKPTFQFKSCYVLKEHKYTLSEKAFHEAPYAVPRWTKTSGEKYGRGPGMEMLPDTKMVNKMMETLLKGAQMTVAPPLMVPDDGVIGKIRLTPAGVTVVRPGEQYNIKPLVTGARIDFGQNVVEDVRKRIRTGFYVDQLQFNEGPQMTATEVMQRMEEKFRFMGPVLGRQHFEFLRPVIERMFGIMKRRNLIPEAPEKIKGKKFDVRYSSVIARAQRLSETQNFGRAIQVAAPLINAKPEALDNLDADASLKWIFEQHGVPHKLLHNAREVSATRKARADAQQVALQQQKEAQTADQMSKMMPGMAQMKQADKQ